MKDKRLAVIATLWGLATVALTTMFVLAVPAMYARKLEPIASVAVGLDRLGMPVEFYAAWWTLTLSLFALVCLGCAGVIVWRRPRDPIVWVVALLLVALAGGNAPAVEALVWQRPELTWAATLSFQLLLSSLVLFLFTFPDGRFRPRGSWLLVVAASVGFAAARGSVANPVTSVLFVAVLGGLATGVAAQIHRYRRRSDMTQRQQTRWVVAASAFAVFTQLAFPALEALPIVWQPGVGAAIHDLASVLGISVGFGTMAVAIAVAVLRHRLWNLTAVVNRALVFGVLTLLLLALYVVVVTTLGRSLGAPGNASGSLLGAAMVALAFAPLRDRLQRVANRLLYGQREEPYKVLTDLGQRLEATLVPEGVLQALADTLATAMNSPCVAIKILRDGVAETSARAGRDPSASGGEVEVALYHHREKVGELLVAPRGRGESFNPADRALLADLARQAGAAVHAVRLTEELHHSREALVTAREEERRRLRRDLHDGLGPALASMTLQAEAAVDLLDTQPTLARTILTDLVDQLQASTSEVRRVVYDLRPPALDDLGLADAIRTFLDRSASGRLRCELDLLDPLPELSAAAEAAVYRIVQEAVTNVLRHAEAARCRVAIAADGRAVTVEVTDDGVGLSDHAVEGVGMRSMRERAAELGGSCGVTRLPRGGTRVEVTLPRAAPTETVA